MPLVDEMREAGFSDDTIGSWVNEQRPAMKEAGFDDDTIDSYFSGINNPKKIPPPLIDRFTASMGRIAGGAAEGAKAGFGEAPLGIKPEDEEKLRHSRVLAEPGEFRSRPMSLQASEALIRGTTVGVEAMFRGINAAFMGAGAGVGQAVAEATGANESESARARRDFAQIVSIGALLMGTDAPIARAPHVAGAADQVVGHLPQAHDFTAATKIVADGEVPATARAKIVQLYEDHGIHPAEVAHDARDNPEIARSLLSEDRAQLPKEYLAEVKEETISGEPDRRVDIAKSADELEAEGKRYSLGAGASEEIPELGPIKTPSPPGRLMDAVQNAGDKLVDIGKDIQMMVAPMAAGTQESMAIAKDFANAMRRSRYEWSRIDADVEKKFSPEQRERMWNAADEESVARQLGESTEHQGLVTLTKDERAAVDELQERAQATWIRARDLGMVEGEGLPAYTPRMVINVANAASGDGPKSLNSIGQNLRTRTSQMLHRQHMTAEETEAAAKAKLGEEAEIARDIRTLPLATAKLEDAIAGRTLIDNIKAEGRRTGEETVAEGGKPSDPEHSWFTIDHPAFRTWRPKFEKTVEGKFEAVKDAEGNVIFEQVPIYVRDDFEGPLRAVLSQKSGELYNAAMSLKGKIMSLIMNSPLIHNAVEWGRALPAMPGKVLTFKVYFDGNKAKHDLPTMREAINNGLVPIGKRFFNQDITSIMEAPDLRPGRSLTAKVLGFVPGLFDPAADVAVRRAIDKAGDFWHNTLLWDRVADLQMGLYSNFRETLVGKGIDSQTASRAAAHWANRYAGAIPQEAMSDSARKIANMLLFSRSFTMGNLGAMKDMINGLPRDVRAQISRDIGSLDPKAEGYIKSLAVRKAVSIVMLDMGLMYVGNSILQSAFNVMATDRTASEEMRGYAERLSKKMHEIHEHPLQLLQPFGFAEALSSTAENEPGKESRILVGYAKDGTAIYARNPAGKIGEEFEGYLTGPLDMLKRKLGTVARPAWQILSNDAGFGRHIYDPNADAPEKYLKNAAAIAWHIVKSQTPEGQIRAAMDLASGQGDAKVNALQAFGPIAGITFSRGAPGGPAVGELYRAQEQHRFAVQEALPEIRRQIQRGDGIGAVARMTELGIPRGLQQFYLRTSINPQSRLSSRTVRDFYLYATEAQRDRFEQSMRSLGQR